MMRHLESSSNRVVYAVIFIETVTLIWRSSYAHLPSFGNPETCVNKVHPLFPSTITPLGMMLAPCSAFRLLVMPQSTLCSAQSFTLGAMLLHLSPSLLSCPFRSAGFPSACCLLVVPPCRCSSMHPKTLGAMLLLLPSLPSGPFRSAFYLVSNTFLGSTACAVPSVFTLGAILSGVSVIAHHFGRMVR
jgi:hypothetical protein